MSEAAVFAVAGILALIGMRDRSIFWFVVVNLLSLAIRLAGPADLNASHPHINMILLAVNSVCAGIIARRILSWKK